MGANLGLMSVRTGARGRKNWGSWRKDWGIIGRNLGPSLGLLTVRIGVRDFQGGGPGAEPLRLS